MIVIMEIGALGALLVRVVAGSSQGKTLQIAKYKSFCFLCRCYDILGLLKWPGQKQEGVSKNLARNNKT